MEAHISIPSVVVNLSVLQSRSLHFTAFRSIQRHATTPSNWTPNGPRKGPSCSGHAIDEHTVSLDSSPCFRRLLRCIDAETAPRSREDDECYGKFLNFEPGPLAERALPSVPLPPAERAALTGPALRREPDSYDELNYCDQEYTIIDMLAPVLPACLKKALPSACVVGNGQQRPQT